MSKKREPLGSSPETASLHMIPSTAASRRSCCIDSCCRRVDSIIIITTPSPFVLSLYSSRVMERGVQDDPSDQIQRLLRRVQHLEAENERLTTQLVYARASLFSQHGAMSSAGSVASSPVRGSGGERQLRPSSSPSGRPAAVARRHDAGAFPTVDVAQALAQTPGPGEELCDNWCG